MSETIPTVALAAKSLSALESRLTKLGASEAIVDTLSELSMEVRKVKPLESALAGGRLGQWMVAKRFAELNRAIDVQLSCNDLLEADDLLLCFNDEEERAWATLIVTDMLAAVKAISDRLAAFDSMAAPPPPAAPPRLATPAPARRTSLVPMGPPASSRSQSSTAAFTQVNKCKSEEPSASGRPPKVARGASAVAGESAAQAGGVATPVSTGSRPARTPAKQSLSARTKTSSKAEATPARTSGWARKPKKGGDVDMSEDDREHFANPVTNKVGRHQQQCKAALDAPADWSTGSGALTASASAASAFATTSGKAVPATCVPSRGTPARTSPSVAEELEPTEEGAGDATSEGDEADPEEAQQDETDE
ncbi:hypothetical protein K474DRAFT_1680308 [Panus rudis PR-1116 ss-1]|nr:hypothetical protein K474DRAFT_1680308 [Panus rudis PR-1116 ss-1]